MNIRDALKNEIQDELENLGKMELGTDTYKTTVDGITKLVDKAIELEKLDADVENKAENRETEIELKQQQMKIEKRDQIVKNGISIASIVVPTVVTIWGTLKSLKFEETGTITTNAGRNFINRVFKR